MRKLKFETADEAMNYFQELTEFPELDALGGMSDFPENYHETEATVFGTPKWVIEHDPRVTPDNAWSIIYICENCGTPIDGRISWRGNDPHCQECID